MQARSITKKDRITRYLFISLFLLFISTFAHAQCDYDVNVVQQKISDCWSNGIVKATLSGTNVNNGNVQTHDAQFSIESVTPGGYSTAFSKNNGIIENVPPGTYTVTVAAYCKGNWIYKTSQPVTIQGTYVEVNTNAIQVQSANIEKSMACVGTGKVPIKMHGGGKEPFNLTITSAPASYSGPMTFANLPAGVFTISNLTSGNYSFEWSDDCNKKYINLHASVGVINPVFSATVKQHARTCLNEGRIEVTAKDGLRPYKITITAAPVGYPGPTSIPMPDHGSQMIDNLPHGNYSIKIEDACGYNRTYSRVINEIKFPDPNPAKITNSEPCSPTGKISFDLKNGVKPYTIELVTKPASYNPVNTIFTQNNDGTFTLSNLPVGNYVFKAKDGCGVEYTIPAVIASNPLNVTGSTSSKSASCKSNGSITIQGITGGKSPYKIEMTAWPAGYVGNKIFSPVNSANYKISNLPVGNYTFNITDACVPPSTFTINEKVDTLKMTPPKVQVYHSLHCYASGRFGVYVSGGTPPYTITIDSVPGVAWPAPGVTRPIIEKPTSARWVYFDNLPNGQYQITVVDDCGEKVIFPINQTIINGIVGAAQIPGDPFEEYFYPPSSKDSRCKNLIAKRNDAWLNSSNPLYPFWNGTNSEKYFEVKFVYQGDSTAWQPLKKDTPYTLPTSYKEFRTPPGKSVEAIVRIKGDNDTCAVYVHDHIKIKDVRSNVRTELYSCAGFTLRFDQNKGQESIFCYPYKWRLVHGTDTIYSGNNINTSNPRGEHDIFPYGNYVLHFEDKEGYKWQEPFNVNWSNPSTSAVITTHDYLCASYSASFVPNLCFPYSWVLVDSTTNVLHSSKAGIPDNTKQTVTGLQYNVTYKLTFTDKLGDTKDFYIKFDRKQLFDFDIDSDALKCFPDLGKGSMRIFRDNNQNFPIGTQIQYISGPPGSSIPKHANVTITSVHGNVKNYYPYSSDSLFTNKTYEYMPQGIYKFNVIDSCGIVNTLEIDYKVYSAGNLAYTERTSCMGSYIFPTGDIWYGATLQQPWFRIKSAPSGIFVDPGSVTTGGSLFLPESGVYVIQMSLDNSPTSCPIDTLEIEFEKKSVGLDADATIAYICDTLLPGYIFVRATGGEGPYKFELYDNGVLQRTNTTTGDCDFTYGKLGETYIIKVTDIGCGVSFPQSVTMLDISEQRFIYGTQKVCYGDNIYLNSITISRTYSWLGPNGFTSLLQNPVINNADTIMSGDYTITIQPQGCLRNISQSITVDVYLPKEPLGDTLKIMCLNSPSQQLTATASPWHTIQWYASDGTTKLPQAPFPPTNKVDTITYYVSQISDTLGCESPKKPVVAIIDDLPKPLIGGHSPIVCVGDTAVIILPTTDLNYTYIVYSAATGGDSITSGIGTGGQITMKASDPVFSNTKYYIEIINTNQCHGPYRTPINITVEVSPPMPAAKDRNIICLNTVTGPLDATALTGYFLQWYDTDKITLLPGAPTPPTHQVDTITYYVSQKSNGLQCESEKKPITVIISDLPGQVPNAVADSICPNTIPVIIINNSMRDYTYSLYDAPVGGVFMGSVKGTGNSVILRGSTPLTSSTIYYIATLNEYLCEGLLRTSVPIKVVASPNKPTADTLTIICLNTQAPALVATPDPGHYLQWYAPDGVTRLGNAPVPPTNKVDTITYYVSQSSNVMDCEGDKVPVVAIIRDLPEQISSFVEPEICPDQYPTIIINHAYLNYTYNVYTTSTGGILVGSGVGAGGALHLLTTLPVPSSTTYYVEVLNDNQCVGPQRTAVNIKVINYVYIKPDKIPPYDRGKYYSVQLVTNAVPPYQWTVLQSLPYGFEFNLLTGEITGTAPRQGYIDPSPFSVKVVDKNGCVAIKEYALTSDLDVPENFSPNGDGMNDHFMKEKRLIIFDRLGIKIFEGTDGWDGTYNGKPAPSDVYYYVIFYKDYMDRDAHKTGFINLLR